jgi:hypothetical protein
VKGFEIDDKKIPNIEEDKKGGELQDNGDDCDSTGGDPACGNNQSLNPVTGLNG